MVVVLCGGKRRRRHNAFRDAGMLMCSLWVFFFPRPPRHLSTSPHLTSGAPRMVGAGSLGGGVREGGAGLRGALCVCLSLGDCIRRCSSITARVAVVCAAALVWRRRQGGAGELNKVGEREGGQWSGPAGKVERGRRREEEEEEKR